jgi:hypothetical protein
MDGGWRLVGMPRLLQVAVTFIKILLHQLCNTRFCDGQWEVGFGWKEERMEAGWNASCCKWLSQLSKYSYTNFAIQMMGNGELDLDGRRREDGGWLEYHPVAGGYICCQYTIITIAVFSLKRG